MRPLTSDELQHYHAKGHVVLPDWLTPAALSTLQAACDALLAEPPDDDHGGRSHDIGRGQDRRFLRHRHTDIAAVSELILGTAFKDVVCSCLDADPYLFNEQFVVKGPNTGASFAWHQDSGYLDQPHAPYLSVWLALDDTTAANGALSVIDRDLETERCVDPHRWDEVGKERVGYDGDDPGTLVEAAAGSAVLFSSLTLHRSSANTTRAPRRAYLVQYSPEPIYKVGTTEPKVFATAL
ncbi:MAG: phytanoyl-CoA dioxygenase family protein [Pseudomonadota bacterium]